MSWLTEIVSEPVAEFEVESVTVTPKVADPTVVGVPVIVPLAFSVRPGGGRRLLEYVHVVLPTAPAAVNCCEYAIPTVPPGRVAGDVIPMTFTVYCWLPELGLAPVTTALIVNVKLPADVSAPDGDMTPVAALKATPGGRLPADTDQVIPATKGLLPSVTVG